MKISTRLENVFSIAVAMDNRGLKNTIHCVGTSIYIINFDHSMILRFRLRKSEVAFKDNISFNANDYDSSYFEVKEGKIIFKTNSDNYERSKTCGMADYDIKNIQKTYREHFKQGDNPEFSFHLSSECCELLDDNLSHTEISIEKGKLILRQRNIYAGTIVEVSPKKAGMFDSGNLPESFGPVGLKTRDFLSLFTFYKSLAFIPVNNLIIVKDIKKDFDGILAFCKYDEIINLRPEGEEENGRKKQKVRRSK